MRILAFISALALSLAASYAGAVDRQEDNAYQVRSEVYARNGMAATSHPIATQVALDILRRGGSAIDAAIAANAFIGFAEPTGNGIGGDLFAIVWDASEGRLHGLNASGRAPALATIEAVRAAGHDGDILPPYGPLPVTVPGAVDGWFELHERFGRLPMATLLQPAINYARQGVPVPETIAYYWRANVARIGHYPGFAETFTNNGEPFRMGEIFRNPDLANTLEAISEGGREAFYRGDIARTIGAFMEEQGGFLRYEDLAAHRSEWVDPVSVNYRGYDVWELPPNGQGIAALQMLNILEGYDLASMGFGSAEYMHVFTEAKKLVFADRARYYADQAFADVPIEALLSEEYADMRRAMIDLERASTERQPGMPESQDTIYMTVADGDGNMISLIQSNYRGMGSGMIPTGLGFILQDRGQQFNIQDPEHPNALAPGKRPFHTIIPAFVTHDGEPWMSFGLMGGAMQPQGHVQIIVNLIDFGMNLQQAGDAPRMRHDGADEPDGSVMTDGGTLSLESGFDPAAIERLRAMGHDVGSGGHYGGYQAIRYDAEREVYIGATESRKDGHAAGY